MYLPRIILSILLLLGTFCLPGRAIAQKKDCCVSHLNLADTYHIEIRELGLEYRRLKRSRCEACNTSMSDYRHIMQQLGQQLNGKTKKQVRKAMGPPDARQEGKYIYFWRGWHDYLYFTITAGVARADWYYAYE